MKREVYENSNIRAVYYAFFARVKIFNIIFTLYKYIVYTTCPEIKVNISKAVINKLIFFKCSFIFKISD